MEVRLPKKALCGVANPYCDKIENKRAVEPWWSGSLSKVGGSSSGAGLLHWRRVSCAATE